MRNKLCRTLPTRHDRAAVPQRMLLMLNFCYNIFMRGLLANAVMVAGLTLPLCIYAQPRGVAHSSFSHSPSAGNHHSYPIASPPSPRRPSPSTSTNSIRRFSFLPATGTSLINPGEASCVLNPSYAGSYYCRQYFSGRPGWGFEPTYPYWMPSTGYESEESSSPSIQPEQDPLAAQVGNLTAEVELMRQEQAQSSTHGAPTPAAPPPSEPPPPTTVFVYRDGHQMEAQNYAMLGNTLWVFSDQQTRQFPLGDIDLTATERVNEERGVDFVPPASR
jgi:hypothetical protein